MKTTHNVPLKALCLTLGVHFTWMVDIKGADYWSGLVAYGKKSLEEIFF